MTGRLPDADLWLQQLGLQVIWERLDEIRESIVPPVIMLNASASPREQRWLTFHAIAHAQMHCGNQLYMLRRGDRLRLAKQERQAERWTADILVPTSELVNAIAAGMGYEDLAEHFEVPLAGVRLAMELIEQRVIVKHA